MKNNIIDLENAATNYADNHGFRVPYDGSNNFYDDVDVKASKEGFIAGANWEKQRIMSNLDKYIDETIKELDSCGIPCIKEKIMVKLQKL